MLELLHAIVQQVSKDVETATGMVAVWRLG